MQPDVRADFEFGRRYLPHLKAIVGEHLVGEAPFEDDAKMATDLIVLRLEAVRIACRVRHHEYLARYPNEFTIRTSRPSGTETELAKVISRWGDYMIYGFADESEQGPALSRWVLGDLNVFRLWFSRYLATHGGELPGLEKPNRDGTRFRAFRISDLPAQFVIARSTHPQTATATAGEMGTYGVTRQPASGGATAPDESVASPGFRAASESIGLGGQKQGGNP